MLGRDEEVSSIHGGMGRDERRVTQELFTQDRTYTSSSLRRGRRGHQPSARAPAGHYDLPWNRTGSSSDSGRIHRIGQTEVCHMWSLVAQPDA